MKLKRSHKQDKLARIYDAEILPIWSQKFGRLILRDLTLPPKANVLDVGCGTGYPALDILRRMDDHSRIIAIDPSGAMLDEARAKAGPLSGKRIFFRSESAEPRLSFANDVYDLVVANLALHEMEDPQAAVRDFARVTKPGGRVVATLPLAGTFSEFYDIFREVLVKKDLADAITRLDNFVLRQPEVEDVSDWLERAGLADVTVETDRFTILFRSSREFFFAPLIDYCWLGEWKQIAGRGPEEVQEIFWAIKEAIDAYFGDQPFAMTVVAGVARGRKPTEDEAVLLYAKRPIEVARAADAVHSDTAEITGVTNQIIVGTGEIEVIEEEDVDDAEADDLTADALFRRKPR